LLAGRARIRGQERPEPGYVGGGRGGVRAAGRMALGRLGERFGSAGAYRALEVSGLVAELGEAGLAGKVGHCDSFRSLAVRVASRKEECLPSQQLAPHRWTLSFPRTGGALRTWLR
jgi:hypothetical protein